MAERADFDRRIRKNGGWLLRAAVLLGLAGAALILPAGRAVEFVTGVPEPAERNEINAPEACMSDTAGVSRVIQGAASEEPGTVGVSGMIQGTASLQAGASGERKMADGAVRSGGGGDPAVTESEREDTAPQRKQVALTFDDGPHPVYTGRLLDGLKDRGVQATFFVVGKNVEGNEDLIRRMEEEGHLIGNHTYDHVKISDMNDSAACAQVEKTSALVREITGKDTEFVRPPFGSWKKTLECSFEMIPVLWDVDPLDWTTKNTPLVVQRVLDQTEPGDIILLHDAYRSSVDAALQIADTLLQEGYEFVTVDKLILE